MVKEREMGHFRVLCHFACLCNMFKKKTKNIWEWEDGSAIHKISMLHTTKNSCGSAKAHENSASLWALTHSLFVRNNNLQHSSPDRPKQWPTEHGNMPTKLHPTLHTPLRAAASVLPLNKRWRLIVNCVSAQEGYLKHHARDKQTKPSIPYTQSY